MAKAKKTIAPAFIQLDSIKLQTGQIIDYTVNEKIFKGKIVEFRHINNNDWNVYWMSLEDIVSTDIDWVSCNIWKAQYDAGLFTKVEEAFMQTVQASESNLGDFI